MPDQPGEQQTSLSVICYKYETGVLELPKNSNELPGEPAGYER